MRCDVYLKACCLVKRRAYAKELIINKRVIINGLPAKAGRDIKENDLIILELPTKTITIKVKEVPSSKNVSKEQAKELYEVIDVIDTPEL